MGRNVAPRQKTGTMRWRTVAPLANSTALDFTARLVLADDFRQSRSLSVVFRPIDLMSALDTAKEIVRLGSTVGLSKDVIDLLEKKAALLTEQVGALERENADLKAENAQLRAQLQQAQPVGFEESMGVLWKRTARGFENNPYCKECPTHPIMTQFQDLGVWACANNKHHAPLSVRPPSA